MLTLQSCRATTTYGVGRETSDKFSELQITFGVGRVVACRSQKIITATCFRGPWRLLPSGALAQQRLTISNRRSAQRKANPRIGHAGGERERESERKREKETERDTSFRALARRLLPSAPPALPMLTLLKVAERRQFFSSIDNFWRWTRRHVSFAEENLSHMLPWHRVDYRAFHPV